MLIVGFGSLDCFLVRLFLCSFAIAGFALWVVRRLRFLVDAW